MQLSDCVLWPWHLPDSENQAEQKRKFTKGTKISYWIKLSFFSLSNIIQSSWFMSIGPACASCILNATQDLNKKGNSGESGPKGCWVHAALKVWRARKSQSWAAEAWVAPADLPNMNTKDLELACHIMWTFRCHWGPSPDLSGQSASQHSPCPVLAWPVLTLKLSQTIYCKSPSHQFSSQDS